MSTPVNIMPKFHHINAQMMLNSNTAHTDLKDTVVIGKRYRSKNKCISSHGIDSLNFKHVQNYSTNNREFNVTLVILFHVFFSVSTQWKCHQPTAVAFSDGQMPPEKPDLFSPEPNIVNALLSTIYYLKTWCIWALNPPPHTSVGLSLKWMVFCQWGLAPSASVSTLKSEGQRGDVSIDTLLEITLSPPEIPSCSSDTMAGRWLWILGRGLSDAIKKANVINF